MELHRLLCSNDTPLEAWATSENLDIDKFELARAQEFYPEVFLRRFRGDRERGYAYLESVMENAEPSYGYSVLAQILSDTRHRVVITTNFDNLVADAISIYGSKYPLVAGHEFLSGFVQARPRRPLVAKLHRDLFLEPKNDPDGVSTLPESWRDPLKRLLREYTPIVVGYGGNDGSLMGFLDKLGREDVVGRVRWCHREGTLPPERVLNLLQRLDGVLVPIAGFDELMLLTGNELELKLRDEYVRNRGEQRARELSKQFERLALAMAIGHGDNQSTTTSRRDAEQAVDQTLERSSPGSTDSPAAYVVRASREGDRSRKISLLREGLAAHPENERLSGYLAVALASDPDATPEEMKEAHELARHSLTKAEELAPGAKAMLLHNVLEDFPGTETAHQEARGQGRWELSQMLDSAELALVSGDPDLALVRLDEADEEFDRLPEAEKRSRWRLTLALLRYAALLAKNMPADEELRELRSLLSAGVRLDHYLVRVLLHHLEKSLEPERFTFVRALILTAVGRQDATQLEQFDAWRSCTS